MTKESSNNKNIHYKSILGDISTIIETARRSAARSVNCVMTTAYWLIGRYIVEFEQSGEKRAGYGTALIEKLAVDLTQNFGRGFSRQNLQQMRLFYLLNPLDSISQTVSGEWPSISIVPICQTLSGEWQVASMESLLEIASKYFPLPWSAYVRLLTIKNENARRFYETEALRGGWSVRQLDRQINSQFYERTALSRNKTALRNKGQKALPEDTIRPEEEIKDPYVLEFLGLKDEYSETDLEEALLLHLETFLLELGGDFCFVGKQKRLRIGDEWYRVDLVFFHRRLRSLVIIDLKIGKFTHADAGQMHLYLNYAKEYWIRDGENPPIGLILCAYKDEAVARYALEGLPNKVMAAEYRMALPDEKELAAQIEKTRNILESKALFPQTSVKRVIKDLKNDSVTQKIRPKRNTSK